MKVLELVQGSPEWTAARGQYDCASEAPSVMAASTKTSRNELLHMKATGAEKVFSDYVLKRVINKGHTAEAQILPYAEEIIGTELYPATGVNGNMLASFDGITMDERTSWEHKLWNEELAAAVRANDLPAEYYWQLEHQAAVGKVERVLFMVSDGTRERCVYLFYTPSAERQKQLHDGWAQFHKDLASFTLPAVPVTLEAKAIEALPPLSIALIGQVKSSNLEVYRTNALEFIRGINTNLQNDQDFADAEVTIKFCDRAEKELKLVKEQALGQTVDIAKLFATVDQLSEEMRKKRLELDRLVTARKDAIRFEIRNKADQAFTEHIAVINKRLGKVQLPAIRANFAEVMKGKRTISSLQGAVDDEMARVKIESNALAEKIDANLASLRELAAGYEFLFGDAQQLVMKDNADLVLLIESRVSAHKKQKAEQEERERARIREEERVKLEREQAAAARLAEQQKAAESAPAPVAAPAAAPTPPEAIQPARATAGAATSVTPIAAVALVAAGKRIKLGDINAMIAPLSISADGLAQLGFQSIGTDRSAKLYEAAVLPQIIRAMVDSLSRAQLQEAA